MRLSRILRGLQQKPRPMVSACDKQAIYYSVLYTIAQKKISTNIISPCTSQSTD